MRYVCSICGYVYDEAQNPPWNTLSDDWKCPLCGAAKALVEIGGAKEIYACVTHGVLSGPAIPRIQDSCIEHLLLLDTIPYPKDQPMLEKVSYISSAPVFAEAIRRIYEEVSIANMFDN